MITIEKSIIIEAPVAEVFAYTVDPNNLPEYYTGVDAVKDVRRLPNGGYAFTATHKIAGLNADASMETAEFVSNEWLVTKGHSPLLDLKLSVRFEQLESAVTRVTGIAEYTFPGGPLAKLGEAFLTRYYEHAVAMSQATMKAQIEVRKPAATAR